MLFRPSAKEIGALKSVLGILIVSKRVSAQNFFTLIELIANFFPVILASKSKQRPIRPMKNFMILISQDFVNFIGKRIHIKVGFIYIIK